MKGRKLSALLIVTAMVCVSFTMCFSNEVEATEFIETVSSNGLGPNFYPQDVKWDHTGTMAVVVGYDTLGGPNAYAYFPLNDTWMPLDGYYPGQALSSVDYYYYEASNGTGNGTEEPTVPDVLVVDADYHEWGLSNYYEWSLQNNSANVTVWDVWASGVPNQGKPNSADLSLYDLVVWVPSYDMDGDGGFGSAFDTSDVNRIANYLDNGGNFFLSSTTWTSYTDVAPWGSGTFAYDYLALSDFSDASNYQDAVSGISGDSAFAGFGPHYLDWSRGGWGGQPTATPLYCDMLTEAFAGAACMNNMWDMPPLVSVYGGVKNDAGTFKTMFMSFPFETLSQADADEFWNRTLDWYGISAAGAGTGPTPFGAGGASPKASTKTTLDQGNEWMGNMAYYDVGSNPPFEPWAQSFIPNANHISKAEFYMYSQSDPPDNFLIEICPDNFGEPHSLNLTYGWISQSTVPIDPARGWAECWFENGGAALIPGNTYWIVCDRLTTASAQHWAVDIDQMYTEGVVKDYMGSWGAVQPYDWLFRTYANETTGVPSATLGPDKDNGIFNESNDESNGGGMVLRAGKSGVGDLRRSFIHFDVASSIPAGSTIDHVELKMYCNRSSGGPQDISLNRVQVNWGEGTSDDGGTQAGDPATPGDCTWHYTFYPTTTWISDGGDYVAPSATKTVTSDDEFYTWGSTSLMVGNVQSWLDTPGSNYGWAIIGDEGTNGLIKQFSSRENNNNTRRPELQIFYTPPNGSVTVSIMPEKDNTIYDNSPPPEWSNGWGDNLFAGEDVAGNYKRALMKFDIEGSIPDGATITIVNLTLYCDKYDKVSGETLRINNLNGDWGEASSHAPGNEESPDGAQLGDATWNYTFMNTDMWASPGGDFIPAPSDSITVGNSGRYYTWSSATMISDVQDWLDNAGTNNGWIVIGNEGAVSTTKRFCSRSHRTVSQRPMLNITYTMGSNGTGNGTTVGMGTFWMCGNVPGGMPATSSTVYKLEPTHNFTMQKVSTWTKYGTHIPFTALALDDLGNPLCAGDFISSWYYHNGTDWCQLSNPGIAGYRFQGIDFNPNDDRFYLVGDNGASQATTWYSEVGPLYNGAPCYRDLSGFPEFQDEFISIAWNHLYNYGMVAGADGVFLVDPYGGGPPRLNWTTAVNKTGNDAYFDCDWDTDGWNEAGIVGTNDTGDAYYWRYYHTNPQVMYGHHTSPPSEFYCCAFKPPSSPKWLFIPHNGGGYQINVEANDQSSILEINANYPHIFSLGFWKQSDIFHTPLLDTQVDPDTTYTFCIEGNYTQGGVDHWNGAALEITAWYDEGWMGTNSNPDDPTWSTENHRTRQFNMTYDIGSTASTMNYPAGFPEEFAIHSIWADPNTYGFDSSYRFLYINLTFKAQTLAADGDGMWDAPSSNRVHEKNFALNDANSWDFRVALYDTGSTDVRNETYGEFGIKETMSISVSGNPGGSLPPGSVNSPLSEPSVITYSSNTEYWVNVSIPHLYKDGNELSPYWIPATGVTVQNTHTLADMSSSDIWAQTSFAGSNQELSIWGISGPINTLNPTYNGTISAGPGCSEYTTFMHGIPSTTEVLWWVSVPALPEGSYWGTITLTIEDW